MGMKTVRIAAVADLHCGKASQGSFQGLFSRLSEAADVVLLAGDLTDHGLPEEAVLLAKDVSAALRIPAVAVLGNHDYESGHAETVIRTLCDAGVMMLDGESVRVHDLTIVGVKGFGGGFDDRVLQPWGEDAIKRFVQEAVQESVKLESALARVPSGERVVLLHYAPVVQTVEGEAPELFPFLGSSRLEEPLNRYRVAAVFHGHSHYGSPEGRTRNGIPVYNAALPLLLRHFPDRPPFHVIEVRTEVEEESHVAPQG